jgi:hypothetical protein
MGEFSSRIESQRQILKAVNSRPWAKEQLFALSTSAIQRWASVNNVDTSSRLAKLLSSASAQIFVMANHSEDQIAGAYSLSKKKVDTIALQVSEEVSNWK